MKTVNNKILVRSDVSQKDFFILSGFELKSPSKFDTNYRRRSPVMCMVSESLGDLMAGDILLCHHNTFYLPSPYHVGEDLFSIPCNGNIIFAKLCENGDLWPLFGNILCEAVEIKTILPVPESAKKYHTDRAIVTEPALANYNKGDLVLTRPSAPYEIVYTVKGEKRTQFKVHESMVAGVVSG